MSVLRASVYRSVSFQRTTRFHPPARSLFTSSPPPPSRSPLITGLYTSAFIIASGLFAVYYFDARSALHRYFVAPVLRHTLDAETGHKIAVKVLRSGLGPKDPLKDDERLKLEIWGVPVTNPVGLAAGFDKDGEAIDGLLDLGFSWVEIGSVTPKPQPGNLRPRVFHLPDDSALINRYGFPSQGHTVVQSRLRQRLPRFPSPVVQNGALRDGSWLAVNLGKNKDSPADSIDDFVAGIRNFGPYSDVLVINVSSPNTPGLRGLQNRVALEALLDGVMRAREEVVPVAPLARKPRIVLKIAPDLNESQLVDMADVIRASKIDGVIVSNTTVQRPSSLTDPHKTEAGGLSGVPLKPYSINAIRTLRSHLPASVVLIGCGGISTGGDALEYAKAGASLVQVYTGFGYDGAGACRRIKDEIVELLAKDGSTWADVVRRSVDELSLKAPSPERIGGTDGDMSVSKLIAEAEELKRLIDRLGEEI